MTIFKCKMCGGTLEIHNNESVAECEYCGTRQTLPKLNDERKANLYDRANHFRRNNEFDKAEGIYDQILNEDNTDAEVYWSLVLCHYGIEYVEDPATHKRVPTVNRAQFTSVFDDDNYKSALQYADLSQKVIYEKEAQEINEIQKGILAISQKEEPFDVFICYKETDNNGRRTPDSVLANDLYHQLTQEGFKVFFSRITLEDKLGSAYEPYIFAALNSAKVMVVLGTKPEFFKAVWVRNEWSRYLSLIKQGQNKMLIPAYRDMDPYDLPEEFSHLQAQDMSKLGFMQDLIRGIKKITKVEQPNVTVVKETVIAGSNLNTAPLLKRAFMFLEDGDWDSADEYCEKVLDIDPECAEAYLGKLMVELKVSLKQDLKNCLEPFSQRNYFKKVMRFADEHLQGELQGYMDYIVNRNLENAYKNAVHMMNVADAEDDYKKAAGEFQKLQEYKDSKHLYQECLDKAEEERLTELYDTANSLMYNAEDEQAYKIAAEHFCAIKTFKDAAEKEKLCFEKAEISRKDEIRLTEELEIKEENAQKKIKSLLIVIVAILIFAIGLYTLIIPGIKYHKAKKMIDIGLYTEAYEILLNLGDYRDASEELRKLQKYNIQSSSIGSFIKFGTYNQGVSGNNTDNEEIEWLVLDKVDEKILVVSKYALDCQPYNGTSWETCHIRQWLNGKFINTAFNSDQQKVIENIYVLNPQNKDINKDGGSSTQDKIFLLSIDEVQKYFKTNEDRKCIPTKYAIQQGATQYKNGMCYWWLRTSSHGLYGCIVRTNGKLHTDIDWVYDEAVAVRPAMWINLNNF